MNDSMPMLNAMYDHSAWANKQLLDAAAKVSEDQLEAPVPGSDLSLLGILLHQMSAQFGWLRRFKQLEPVAPPRPEDYPDVNSLRQRWVELDTETDAYIKSLTPADLDEVLRYRSWAGWEGKGPLWEILLHQAFHQHQHRGEVALILTSYGHSPGEIDILDYLEQADMVQLSGY